MKSATSEHKFNTCNNAHIQCFAHTLQLAVHDGLNQDPIEEAASVCRKVVGFFYRSTSVTHALKEYQRRQGEKQVTLVQDVATRWNSLSLMFQRLVKLRSGVYHILHDNC